MKNGLELANERLQIINDIQEKIDELQKVNNITDRERLEKDIDILEESDVKVSLAPWKRL